MRHRARAAIITAACVIVVGTTAAFAAPVIYRNLFAAAPEKIPTLSVEDGALDPSTGEALDPAALSGTWTVTAGSEAGYRVNEVLNGTNVTVTGRTPNVTGTVTADKLTITDAKLTVDVATIATDNGNRDAYFRDQAMHVSEHPTATFVLSEPVTAAAAPKSGEPVEQRLSGELTVAGVTRSVELTAQMRTDGATANVVGRIPVTFEDFGVTAPSLGFVKVEPKGYIEFELVLKRA